METTMMGYIEIIGYVGGCQNYGSLLDPYYNAAWVPKKGQYFGQPPVYRVAQKEGSQDM